MEGKGVKAFRMGKVVSGGGKAVVYGFGVGECGVDLRGARGGCGMRGDHFSAPPCWLNFRCARGVRSGISAVDLRVLTNRAI